MSLKRVRQMEGGKSCLFEWFHMKKTSYLQNCFPSNRLILTCKGNGYKGNVRALVILFILYHSLVVLHSPFFLVHLRPPSNIMLPLLFSASMISVKMAGLYLIWNCRKFCYGSLTVQTI